LLRSVLARMAGLLSLLLKRLVANLKDSGAGRLLSTLCRPSWRVVATPALVAFRTLRSDPCEVCRRNFHCRL
jgi:hypothetical protein